MTIKRSNLASDQDTVMVTETCPLGLPELQFVRDCLSEITSDWSADLHGICADEATLVLLPEGGDDAIGPTFLISRESFGFRLDQLHWDIVDEAGLYSSLAEVVAAVRDRLALNDARSDGPPPTVH